jgi:uncharacterized protein
MKPTSAMRPSPALKTAATQVGVVGELWRYPVKSMLGEQQRDLFVAERGALGDRAWALREEASGRIASAKRFPRLLEFRAGYETEPTLEGPGRVRIEAPDGQVLHPDEEGASETISEFLGSPVRLESQARSDEKTGIDPATVFAGVPVAEMKPEWTPETMPDYFQLKKNTFFEIGSVFVLASGSVERLHALQGGTARVDSRRFRPNVYVQTPHEPEGFVEDDWVGGSLAVGESLLLGDLEPTLWCVTSTLAQQDLPRDPSILRTAAQHHGGCLGVYASVVGEGLVSVGDPVLLIP